MASPNAHRDLLSCAELRLLGRRTPELLERIEAKLGVDEMRRFAGTFGGMEIGLPRAVAPSRSAVARRCGARLAEWLAREIGHGNFTVPRGPASNSNRALATCVRMLATGASTTAICVATGLTRRTIERTRAIVRHRRVDLSRFLPEPD